MHAELDKHGSLLAPKSPSSRSHVHRFISITVFLSTCLISNMESLVSPFPHVMEVCITFQPHKYESSFLWENAYSSLHIASIIKLRLPREPHPSQEFCFLCLHAGRVIVLAELWKSRWWEEASHEHCFVPIRRHTAFWDDQISSEWGNTGTCGLMEDEDSLQMEWYFPTG
jgi:hypothetical protein